MTDEELKRRYWFVFTVWAEQTGVSVDHEDDWGPWWECFRDGVLAGLSLELIL